jgi:TonB family protein
MESHRISWVRFASLFRFLILLPLMALPLAGFLGAQTLNFDSLASRLSAYISMSSGKPAIKPSVLVMDFVETDKHPSQLGSELAAEFSTSLPQNARSFVVVNGDRKFEDFKIARSAAPSGGDGPSVGCSAGQSRPTIVVDGYVDVLDDRVALRIKATRIEDMKTIFDERITLPLTPELQSLESKPVPGNGSSPAGVGTVWNRPGFTLPHAESEIPIVNADDKTYIWPRCLHCPNAGYSDSALAAKIQGSVTLKLLVDSEGLPARIVVVKGLPCGLNDKAIETAAKWKLSPAIGPDGKPTAVWQEAEVAFQLF